MPAIEINSSFCTDKFLDALARDLKSRAAQAETWCIFNNTATETGLKNALTLHDRLTA